jgi:hypothetical protein
MEAEIPRSDGENAGMSTHPPNAKENRDDILWCCHIRGPDDVHAAPDYETALKWADMTNAINWRGKGGKIKPVASYDDCLLKAVPALWPWSAELHAEALPKSIAEFTPRAP